MSLPKEGSRDVHDGIIVSMVPDICLTPAGGAMVPVPYTIWCRQADAANLANSVRQTDDRSHAIASIVLHCFGDEPGTGGGVTSGTTGAECTPKTWSQNVRVESRNMVRHTDLWWMNHHNTYGILTYAKDIGLYEKPETEQIAPQIRPSTVSAPSSASSSQVAQLAHADGGVCEPMTPYDSFLNNLRIWSGQPHIAVPAVEARSHPDGKDQSATPQITKGTGINNGVRVSAHGKRDYCPSPKHNPNKPWKNADPMDLDDVEAWRVLNGGYSIPLPGGARAAIHNGKLYIFQSDNTENECFHGYNVSGKNGLTKLDKSALQSLKDFFEGSNNTTMSGVVSQIAKTIGMGKI